MTRKRDVAFWVGLFAFNALLLGVVIYGRVLAWGI